MLISHAVHTARRAAPISRGSRHCTLLQEVQESIKRICSMYFFSSQYNVVLEIYCLLLLKTRENQSQSIDCTKPDCVLLSTMLFTIKRQSLVAKTQVKKYLNWVSILSFQMTSSVTLVSQTLLQFHHLQSFP